MKAINDLPQTLPETFEAILGTRVGNLQLEMEKMANNIEKLQRTSAAEIRKLSLQQ